MWEEERPTSPGRRPGRGAAPLPGTQRWGVRRRPLWGGTTKRRKPSWRFQKLGQTTPLENHTFGRSRQFHTICVHFGGLEFSGLALSRSKFSGLESSDMNRVCGVGVCQNTAVDNLAVRFWKISTRSSDLQLQDGQISVRSIDTHPWKSSQTSFCTKHRCRRQ